MLPYLDNITDWIVWFVHQGFLAPILLLGLEEAGIPMPIPGDVMVAFSGYNVFRKLLSYQAAMAGLMAVILIGASILFWLSSRYGNLIVFKFGKFLHLHPERLLIVEKKFAKYGPWVIIFGRHIPGFRIPITVFAGMSGVKYRTFILSTLVSTIPWVVFYLNLGLRLGRRVSTLLRLTSSHWILLYLAVILTVAAFLVFRIKKGKS